LLQWVSEGNEKDILANEAERSAVVSLINLILIQHCHVLQKGSGK
jgi:hypothetical protein